MALYYGMRCGLNLGGIFALSSFLGDKSIVYEVSPCSVTCSQS